MKKKPLHSLCFSLFITCSCAAQNVGIGTNTPLMNLHVASTDSAVALLENQQSLNTNISNALYFKTGNGSFPYTGAIKTIGQAASTARLGFFTFASASANGLRERMSITDAGFVGIGTNAPQTFMHINPNAGGSLLIGTNKSSGGYTNLEMGISAQSNGYGYIQAIKTSGTSYGNLIVNANGGNVGIGTTSPQATLDVNGGMALPIKVVTTDYAVLNSDYTVVANMREHLNYDLYISLPFAQLNTGRIIKIVADSLANRASGLGFPGSATGNIIIVDPFNNELGTLSFNYVEETHSGGNGLTIHNTYFVLYEILTYQSDGTKWYVIDEKKDIRIMQDSY